MSRASDLVAESLIFAQKVRQEERADNAELIRAAESQVFNLLRKSFTREQMAKEIVKALAAAIEARGRA